MQCQEIVSSTVKKVSLKRPLGYGLIRSANCFDPRVQTMRVLRCVRRNCRELWT